MKTIHSCTTSSAPALNAAVTHRIQTLLGQISAQRLEDLAAYARYQCSFSPRNSSSQRYLALHGGHELVHEVFEDLLVGLDNPDRGRHPRAEDLINLETFTAYLCGAIRSKRSTLADHAEANTEHLALDVCSDDQDLASLRGTSDPAQETEHADLKQVAFERLRRELGESAHNNTALSLWETNLSDSPKAEELGLSPKQYRNIQKRLRRIFRKLDFGPAVQLQTGKELAL